MSTLCRWCKGMRGLSLPSGLLVCGRCDGPITACGNDKNVRAIPCRLDSDHDGPHIGTINAHHSLTWVG